MPLGFLTAGPVNNAASAAGLFPSQMAGDRGIVQGFVLIGSATGLDPSTGVIEIFPSNGVFASGADGDGNLSVSVTWLRGSSDTEWLQVGGGTNEFPDGFWQTLCRIILSLAKDTISWDIQFSREDVSVYNQDLSASPTNPDAGPPDWNGDTGTVELTIDYDNADNEDPDSIAILRDGELLANIPWVDGVTSYSFVDTVFAAGDYDYEFFVYKYSGPSRSATTSPITVTFGGPASITMTMSGGITFGGSATIVFLGNPNGTYTIVKDKTNDTLYNAEEDTAIPNPFIVTGFLPQ